MKKVTLELSHEDLVNLEVAVRLRVESMDDSEDPDTWGWKPLHKRLERARREAAGLLVHVKRKKKAKR